MCGCCVLVKVLEPLILLKAKPTQHAGRSPTSLVIILLLHVVLLKEISWFRPRPHPPKGHKYKM